VRETIKRQEAAKGADEDDRQMRFDGMSPQRTLRRAARN
jgi:hypothetical protein